MIPRSNVLTFTDMDLYTNGITQLSGIEDSEIPNASLDHNFDIVIDFCCTLSCSLCVA